MRISDWSSTCALPISSFNRGAVANRLTSTRCPRVFDRHSRWRSMAEWRAAGIRSVNGRWPDGNVQATLLEPDGPGRNAHLLYRKTSVSGKRVSVRVVIGGARLLIKKQHNKQTQ